MNFVSIIIDLLLVGVLGVGMILGVKRGFVKTVAKPVKFFTALALAFSLCVWFSGAVIEPFIQTPISNHITEYMNEELAHLTADNIDRELPTILKMSAGLFGINVKELAQTSTSDVVRSIVDELTTPVIHVIAVIISFIILYFVSRLLLTVVIKLLDYILKSGPLGLFNKILGFIFSSAFFFIIDWISVVVIQFIMNFAGISFDGGFVYDMFNTLNPFELLLSF